MNKKQEKETFPRSKMLDLLTADQNNLVLYDLLREKNLTRFCCLLKQGYRLNAFVLNCMLDNGFEDNILTALALCQKADADVFDFLRLYLGEEKTRDLVVENGWKEIISDRFTDKDLLEYGLWDVILDKKLYPLILQSGRQDLMEKAFEQSAVSFSNFLVKEEQVEWLISLGCLGSLERFGKGRKRLWKDKDWTRVLSWNSGDIVAVSRMKTIEEAYDYILDNGGLNALYKRSISYHGVEIRDYLLRKGQTEIFVSNKNWNILFGHGLYHLVDVEDWWASAGNADLIRKSIIGCAVKQKNWDFLEEKGCLKALFWHFRWLRWYRSLVSCNA